MLTKFIYKFTDWHTTGNQRWHTIREKGDYRLEELQREEFNMTTGKTRWVRRMGYGEVLVANEVREEDA